MYFCIHKGEFNNREDLDNFVQYFWLLIYMEFHIVAKYDDLGSKVVEYQCNYHQILVKNNSLKLQMSQLVASFEFLLDSLHQVYKW